jgi:hypothetical protein
MDFHAFIFCVSGSVNNVFHLPSFHEKGKQNRQF